MANRLFMRKALCAVDSHGGILLPEFVRVPLALRSDSTTILLGSHETHACLVARDPLQAIGAIRYLSWIAGERLRGWRQRMRWPFGTAMPMLRPVSPAPAKSRASTS